MLYCHRNGSDSRADHFQCFPWLIILFFNHQYCECLFLEMQCKNGVGPVLGHLNNLSSSKAKVPLAATQKRVLKLCCNRIQPKDIGFGMRWRGAGKPCLCLAQWNHCKKSQLCTWRALLTMCNSFPSEMRQAWSGGVLKVWCMCCAVVSEPRLHWRLMRQQVWTLPEITWIRMLSVWNTFCIFSCSEANSVVGFFARPIKGHEAHFNTFEKTVRQSFILHLILYNWCMHFLKFYVI